MKFVKSGLLGMFIGAAYAYISFYALLPFAQNDFSVLMLFMTIGFIFGVLFSVATHMFYNKIDAATLRRRQMLAIEVGAGIIASAGCSIIIILLGVLDGGWRGSSHTSQSFFVGLVLTGIGIGVITSYVKASTYQKQNQPWFTERSDKYLRNIFYGALAFIFVILVIIMIFSLSSAPTIMFYPK